MQSPQKSGEKSEREKSLLDGIFRLFGGQEGPETPAEKPSTFQSSAFGYISETKMSTKVRPLRDVSWLNWVQLSVWNYVLGPRALQVWLAGAFEEEHLKTVASSTLSGEFGSSELSKDDPIEIKLLVERAQGLLLVSVVFTAPMLNSEELHKFSLSLVMGVEQLGRYLDLRRVCGELLIHYTRLLRDIMIRIPDRAIHKFNRLLKHFCGEMEELWRASIPPMRFCSMFCNAGAALDFDFLARILTSQLQTQGSAVVFGRRRSQVNAVIDTLALFLAPCDRRRSSYARTGRAFFPNIVVQGVLSADSAVNRFDILRSQRPLSVVDLAAGAVRQTPLGQNYADLRDEHVEQLELTRLEALVMQSSTGGTGSLSQKQLLDRYRGVMQYEPFWREVTQAAPMMLDIVVTTFRLPRRIREAYVEQSLNILHSRAALLIKSTEVLLERLKSDFVPIEMIEKLRADLDLAHDQDFLLVLCIAENITPGIFSVLRRDSERIGDVLVKLFDSI